METGIFRSFEILYFTCRGISSLVRRCVDRTTGKSYAVKIIDKLTEQAGIDIEDATKVEIEILTVLQGHRNISK